MCQRAVAPIQTGGGWLVPSTNSLFLQKSTVEESTEKVPKTEPDSASSHKTKTSHKNADSDHDSVLGSDDDYDERDGFFRQHKKKFHPLNCKLVSLSDCYSIRAR